MRRIGLTVGSHQEVSDSDTIRLAQRADELGYDSVWAGESWGRDVFTVLAMLACHTRQIKLASGIAVIYARTPAMLAQTIASLDIMSSGRAILGLGTSGPLVVEQWHGVAYDRPLARTRECIEIVRLALSGQRVNYQGSLFNLQRFRLACQPIQPRIPIYIAAMGPANLGLTGELADGLYGIWPHVDYIPRIARQVAAGAEKTGRKREEVALGFQTLACVTQDSQDGRRMAKAHLAYYVGGMGSFYAETFRRYGYAEEVEAIRRAWAEGNRDRAASCIPEEIVDKISAVGTAAQCRERLEEFFASGADLLVLHAPHGASLADIAHTIETLAPARG